MLVLLALVSPSVFALTCAGYVGFLPQLGDLRCDQGSAVLILRTFIAALIANQSAYAITKMTNDTESRDLITSF